MAKTAISCTTWITADILEVDMYNIANQNSAGGVRGWGVGPI